MQKIAQNGTMYQQLLMMQQQMMQLGAMVDQAHGTNDVVNGLMNQFGIQTPQMTSGNGEVSAEYMESLGGEGVGESNVTKKERQRVADATSPE